MVLFLPTWLAASHWTRSLSELFVVCSGFPSSRKARLLNKALKYRSYKQATQPWRRQQRKVEALSTLLLFQKCTLSLSSKTPWSTDVHTTVLMRFRLSTLKCSKAIELHDVTYSVKLWAHATNTRELKGAYISPPIGTERLIFGKRTFFLVLFFLNMLFNPIISQIRIFVTSHFSSQFTLFYLFVFPLKTSIRL